MFLGKKSIFKPFQKITKKYFQLLTPEEYFINMRESLKRLEIEQTKLTPLPEANHDPKNTRCRLLSVPHKKVINESFPLIADITARYTPDLIFIQMEPMAYLTRQRFLSHKCALYGVEDFDVKGNENLNEPKPLSWEEAIVDPLVLDMSYANQVHMKLDYTKGFMTYSNPTLQAKSVHDNLTDKFMQAITDYVVTDKWSPYYEINNVLYSGVMGRQKILLGDMPEILLRQILGNTITIEECRDIFKSVLRSMRDAEGQLDIVQATQIFYSHVFLAPKDVYMAAMLKNVLKACYSVVAIVGAPHFLPIQKYWIPPPTGINYTTATTIPKRIRNETDQDLIEKQAIFDVLLGTRVWADKYITNPFPYIEQDITKIELEDLDGYKKTFFINLKKYEAFRDKILENINKKKLENKTDNTDKIEKLNIKKLTDV